MQLQRRRLSRYSTMTAGVISVLGLTGLTSSADETFQPTALVKGLGTASNQINSFDIGWTAHHLYFLADRTNAAVDVVDTNTNTLVNQIGKGVFTGPSTSNDTAGPDGVLTVDQQVWAGDGDSTVKVFSQTGSLIANVSTGGSKRADEGCYDPSNQVTLWANDADSPPFVSFIPTAGKNRYTVTGKISFPEATNGIEQCQWDPRTHRIYLNLPEVNGPGDNTAPGAVVVIDPKTQKVEATWPVPHNDCAGPQGMAIGPDNQILLGCNGASGDGKFSTVIISAIDGTVLRVLNNESGADEVWYNKHTGHYLLARSGAAGPSGPLPSMLGVVDALNGEDASHNTGKPGTKAHSVAAWQSQVYVPIPKNAEPTTTPPTKGVCSTLGGQDSDGCVAVFTPSGKSDHPVTALERRPDDNQE